jgi:hypothetical protein
MTIIVRLASITFPPDVYTSPVPNEASLVTEKHGPSECHLMEIKLREGDKETN